MTKKLFLLNGFAILLVILNHASHWGIIFFATQMDTTFQGVTPESIGPILYYGLLAINRFGICSVPIFLFVSGFFVHYSLGRLSDWKLGWSVISKRVFHLLVPYLIWSLVALSLSLFLYHDQYSWLNVVYRLVTGKVVPEYYFVVVLIQLYLVALLYYFPFRNHKNLMLGVAIASTLLIQAVNYLAAFGLFNQESFLIKALTDWSAFIKWMAFFVFGMSIGKNRDLIRIPEKINYFLPIGIIALFVLTVWEGEFLYRLTSDSNWRDNQSVTSLLFAFFLIVWYISLPDEKVRLVRSILKLNGYVYGVYLLNPIIIPLVANLMIQYTPGLLNQVLLNQTILITAGLGIPLLLMKGFEKPPFNRLYRYLFG